MTDMHKTIHLFFACSVPLLFSCEKSFGIEASFGPETTVSISAGQPDSVFKEQPRLIEEIQKRHQVADVREFKGVWTIDFKHGKNVRLSECVFPALRADESNRWVISGYPTGVTVRKKEDGNLQLPVLSFGTDGFWSLDGRHTDFPIEDYQAFLLQEGNDTLNLQGLLSFDDKLFLYMTDGSIHKYSVVKEGFYLVPDYWMEHLTEKEKMAESAIADTEGDGASFVFITDVHWGRNMKKSPALIRHIYEFTPFDDVIFGGDVITTFYTNLVSPVELGRDFQASFAFLGTRFHCLYGNHDNNSDSQAGKPQYHLSEEQVYSWLQSQMTDVVYGGYYNFYYDNPQTKTRIICLDTGRYYYKQFRDKLPDTVSYAVETLSTLPEGWHAIVASHIWCTCKRNSDGTFRQYFESYITPILKLFDDYNDRLAGTYTYDNQSISYDFTESGGRIEFCIGGHTHLDFTTTSDGGIPVILVASDSEKTKLTGTNEQCFAMIVVDYKDRKLKIIGIGREKDRVVDL